MQEKTGERPETMTRKDAMMFPVIASCALFGLYIFFHIFSKEYINLLLSFYFLVLGIFALSHMMSPIILKLIPSAVPVIPFHLKFTQVFFFCSPLLQYTIEVIHGTWYMESSE